MRRKFLIEGAYKKYSSAAPSAPVMEVCLEREGSPDADVEAVPGRIEGRIDTGAAMTCVPIRVVEELGPGVQWKPINLRLANKKEAGFAVILNVKIDGLTEQVMPVVVIDNAHALIGRDILNNHRFVLDGRRGRWFVDGLGGE